MKSIGVSRTDLYYKIPADLEAKLLRPYQSRQSFSFGTWAAMACAIVAIVLAVFEHSKAPSSDELLTQEVISGHVRSLMASHLMDVVSTDQHTVKPWFAGRLDFSPMVRDFSASGFQLAGGRIDYLESRPVAALIYKRHQHLINLFEWPSPSIARTKFQLLSSRGFQLYRWTDGGMNFWAISDLNAVELQQFAQLVGESN